MGQSAEHNAGRSHSDYVVFVTEFHTTQVLMDYKVLAVLLCVWDVSSPAHPCHSPAGQTSQICSQIFKHCQAEGEGSQLCRSLESGGSKEELEEKEDKNSLDLGVEDLDGAKTSYLANSLHPDEILWTLSSIPWDLIGFYEHFARGVRRGFNDIVSRISSGGTRLYNDVTSIGSSGGYNVKKSQNKISTDEDPDEKKKDTKTKNPKDDPSSPYSINYSGELKVKPNSGYSLQLEDSGGKKSGYYKYSSPGHSLSVAWPREKEEDDWSNKQNSFVAQKEDAKVKDAFKPHPKDEMKYTKYNNYDYDAYGNIYLLSEEETDHYDYDFAPNVKVIKDSFGYKSMFDQKQKVYERAKMSSKYPDSKLMVNLIKGTENMQQPWIQKPPQQKYNPVPPRIRWEKNPNRRRKSGNVKERNTPGARRFDEFAPNSKERADRIFTKSKSNNGNYKKATFHPEESDVDYIDYYYY